MAGNVLQVRGTGEEGRGKGAAREYYLPMTMSGYNFTDRVRKVLQMSREEAARLNHGYIGTEHILLGMIKEGEGVAIAVLINLNVDFEEVRRKIEATERPASGVGTAVGPDLPYTSRAKRVLELAMSEARDLNHSYIGTEHLVLGLLREEKGIAAQVLVDAGASLEQVRAETLRLLGTEEFRPASQSEPPPMEGQSVGYDFTHELREALQAARGEALRLGSKHVDAVHIALAILGVKNGAAVKVLASLGTDGGSLLADLAAKLGTGSGAAAETADLPYSGQAKHVLELAMAEARDLGHRVVGSEHLLLAVMREGVIEVPHATLEQVRARVAALPSPSRSTPIGVRVSWVRVIGGIIFILNGAEALWYAPGLFGKAIGSLGALGGLLLLVPWPAHPRR
jgi:ATP-dependent Clp protease ATP-binding subunit ClpA